MWNGKFHLKPLRLFFLLFLCFLRGLLQLSQQPLYLPPEVILNRGHNGGADHWSLGVLIYEMLTGDTPFYREGMEQMDLFRAIVKGRFTPPKSVSAEANSIIKAFLTRDPAQRLGSLAGGEDDIAVHPWFKDVDFDQLQHKDIKPPKIPKVKDPLDASNFEDWSHLDDKSKKKFPRLTAAQKEVFVVSRRCQHFVNEQGKQWSESSVFLTLSSFFGF